MRLRLFNRVRRTGGLDSGSSTGRGRVGDATGRHRQERPSGRDLWREFRGGGRWSGPGRTGLDRANVAGDRTSDLAEWARRDGSEWARRDGSEWARPEAPHWARPEPSERTRPANSGGGSTAVPPWARRGSGGRYRPGSGNPPRREQRNELPRSDQRDHPARPEPSGGRGDVAMGGARARVRPWFTSPVRERPAVRGGRPPGSAPGAATTAPGAATTARPAPGAGTIAPGRGTSALRPGTSALRRDPTAPGRDRSALRRDPTASDATASGRSRTARQGKDAKRPWYETGGSRSRLRPAAARTAAPVHPAALPAADGHRDCGSLEPILHRQWDIAEPPSRDVIRAIDRLAELPVHLKDMLADGLTGIYVGAGGVPDLDDMRHLRGVPLPSGQATWDICAGAYGKRKIVVGARPSPTPDVMCHEVGHALDDIDAGNGGWQSDTPPFRALYDQCFPRLVSDFHRQPDGLGRREFFADAFAAIASRQRPALVDMLGGDTRTALNVMLYFNRRYGI